METGIRFHDVHKRYRIYRQRNRSLKSLLVKRRFGEWQDVWALRGVDFDIEPGSTMGLIGPNGAGKSTALKLMARILLPDRGRVTVRGRVASLIELGAGFHHEYTGRENVFLNASLLGFSRGEIRKRFDDIVEFAEMGRFIDDPLRTYSSGMQLRLGFSVAIHIDPEVMLLDEILAVGDEAFQSKCFDHIDRFKAQGGTLVLVSHSLDSIRRVCSQTAWIEGGEIRRAGPSREVINAYLSHVYTRSDGHSEAGTHGARAAALVLGDCRLVDEAGAAAEVLQTGAALGVEIPYRRRGRGRGPAFGVTIHGAAGEIVYSTRSEPGPTPAGEGGTAILTFPRLPLLPGLYRLTVAAFQSEDPKAPPADVHVQAYSVKVVPSAGAADEGVVRIEHAWRFEGEPGTGAGRAAAGGS
ncbi:MAG: ABC transporter ATP-binding protein [Candidatus Dormibacterales bacterium]